MPSIETVHIVFGFSSLLFGSCVMLSQKGTRAHKRIGKLYIVSMLGLNLTAFGIYRLFDGFGIFHWTAIVSLLSIIAGYLCVAMRNHLGARVKENWLSMHFEFMAWSYVGLLAATSNEAFVNIGFLNELAHKYNWLAMTCMFGVLIVGGLWIKSGQEKTVPHYRPKKV